MVMNLVKSRKCVACVKKFSEEVTLRKNIKNMVVKLCFVQIAVMKIMGCAIIIM